MSSKLCLYIYIYIKGTFELEKLLPGCASLYLSRTRTAVLSPLHLFSLTCTLFCDILMPPEWSRKASHAKHLAQMSISTNYIKELGTDTTFFWNCGILIWARDFTREAESSHENYEKHNQLFLSLSLYPCGLWKWKWKWEKGGNLYPSIFQNYMSNCQLQRVGWTSLWLYLSVW